MKNVMLYFLMASHALWAGQDDFWNGENSFSFEGGFLSEMPVEMTNSQPVLPFLLPEDIIPLNPTAFEELELHIPHEGEQGMEVFAEERILGHSIVSDGGVLVLTPQELELPRPEEEIQGRGRGGELTKSRKSRPQKKGSKFVWRESVTDFMCASLTMKACDFRDAVWGKFNTEEKAFFGNDPQGTKFAAALRKKKYVLKKEAVSQQSRFIWSEALTVFIGNSLDMKASDLREAVWGKLNDEDKAFFGNDPRGEKFRTALGNKKKSCVKKGFLGQKQKFLWSDELTAVIRDSLAMKASKRRKIVWKKLSDEEKAFFGNDPRGEKFSVALHGKTYFVRKTQKSSPKEELGEGSERSSKRRHASQKPGTPKRQKRGAPQEMEDERVL